MNLRTVLFFFAVLVAFPLTAREKSDVIVMKNGDKITCEVKGLSSNTLFISVDYILNTLSVDWTRSTISTASSSSWSRHKAGRCTQGRFRPQNARLADHCK